MDKETFDNHEESGVQTYPINNVIIALAFGMEGKRII